jgi:hypothetical protein
MTPRSSAQQQIELSLAAARGEVKARAQVNELIHPVIEYHTALFCKRFCEQNRFQYRCSLNKPWGTQSAQAALCEWGNASYGWMLNDLSSANRLLKYQAREGASLFDYLYRIANSLPFYERWKDWRFGRKVHVPGYVIAIDERAKSIFYALQSGLSSQLLAQKLKLKVDEVERITRDIVIQLTRHHRLYLLDSPKTQSLTASGENDEHEGSQQMDVAVIDDEYLQQDEQQHINKAWKTLDTIEQFVLEALVINEQDAKQVLKALSKLDIVIKKGVRPQDTSIQQLYYFKRKSLSKLQQALETAE